MKIAWFSPLPPQHSDIANLTDRLRGALNANFETRFFMEQDGGFHEPDGGVFYRAGLGTCPHHLLASLNYEDLPIYHLGNQPEFFAQTWFLSQYKPGIVILHDTKLHHLFEGIYCGRLRNEDRYLDLLEEHYGPLGRQAGVAYIRSRVPINFMAEHFPMTAWAVRNALAVVVHTPYADQQIREIGSIPVWMIPLPFESRPFSGSSKTPSAFTNNHRQFSPDHRVKVVIFGYLNINRRIIEFLHALASMPERQLFEVHIVGMLHHGREVHAAVDLLSLRNQIIFHGYVSDQKLDEVLEAADLAVNLRYPTMGEASGSQLRIWDHALPSLVTRSEGYSTLARDTVFFVRPEHEGCDIQRHLRQFLRRPWVFHAKGQRGRRRLIEHHQPAMYVSALRAICGTVDTLRSRYNRLLLAERVGSVIAPWADVTTPNDRESVYATRIIETV